MIRVSRYQRGRKLKAQDAPGIPDTQDRVWGRYACVRMWAVSKRVDDDHCHHCCGRARLKMEWAAENICSYE